MQKSVAFLCTNNEISEREREKKSLLKSHQKNLGINLTKEVKDLYAEKYKTLIKETAAAAKSLQLCQTLCDPIDDSPRGSSVPGILQARILEWVAISFSNAWKWKVKVKSLSRARLSSPMDCSLPGSSIHGIFQARVLEDRKSVV